MRVLWVCNIMLPAVAKRLGTDYSVREGWLTGILNILLERGDEENLTLGICFPADGELSGFGGKLSLGKKNRETACYGFRENLARPEAYDDSLEPRFKQILSDFQPDLVHIFGTEFPHAYACAKAWNRPEKTLVGIQGLVGACAESYMAGLPERVQNRKTLRDLLKRDGLLEQQHKFYLRGEREKKLLGLTGHITGRTLFDRSFTERVNPRASYHFMNETMRNCFYEGRWELSRCVRHRIFISQADYPLKGFHYLLHAMQEILQEAPDAEIAVAGNSVLGTGGHMSRCKLPAYGKYLRRLIGKYGLWDKIHVLGRLDAEGMKKNLLSSHVFLCPSAMENSPNSVAEAQLLGVPLAASRTGGIPSVVLEPEGGLLFETGNTHELAQAVLQIFSSDGLAQKLSESERKLAAEKYDGERNYRTLMAIYGELL